MPGLRKTRPSWPFTCLLLLAAAAFAAGCSTSTGKSELSLVDASGNHPAGFITTHPALASPDASACVPCHGDNLQGGISGVSCFTASFGGQACHAAGPTPANHQPVATWVNAHQGEAAALRPTFSGCNAALCHGATLQGDAGPSCFSASFAGFLCHSGGPPPDFHPANWFVDHRAFAIANGTASCATAACHGATLHADPPGATGPSCFRAAWGALACHAGGPPAGGANHAVPYFDNAHFQSTPTTFTSDCLPCHAVTGTSVNPAAPLCTVCHTSGPTLPYAGCTSCHSSPPSGAVGVYPNVEGAHAEHIALILAGTPITCDTCHNGLGTSTLNHYNRANARPGLDALRVPPGDTAFLATYNAATGDSSFDNVGLTCLNVSCHGGQTTPNWQTGNLVVNTGCESCHDFDSTQFNTYSSGQHDSGGHNGETCTACHNVTTLAVNHFTALATPAMEGPASATIGGTGTEIPAGNYDPATGSCTPTCHGNETW